jgi:acyl-CoA thioester hydrolase
MFERFITVRFGECDGLGHVNNGIYFTYFEDARIDIFRLFNPSLELPEWNLIVASAKGEFLKQVTYAQSIKVLTWISHVGNSSFVVEHGIQNEQGEWVARGQAVMLAYDYSANRPQPLWADVRDALALHTEAPAGVPSLRS